MCLGTWKVSCICGAEGVNYDDGKRMVECVECLVWMHTICYGITDDKDPPETMLCSKCVAKKEQAVMMATQEAEEPMAEWFVNCHCGTKVGRIIVMRLWLSIALTTVVFI